MIKINVTIRNDQKELLNKHPSINVSGLLQESVDKLIAESD